VSDSPWKGATSGYAGALDELESMLLAATQVTWTKADGSTNTYRCVHVDAFEAWRKRWLL